MINIVKLKSDMAILGDHIKKLKTEFRNPCKNPSWEQALVLTQHKVQATKLYVFRAGLRNKHHIRDKPCAWHDRIIQDLSKVYEIG